jgi:hypothetical protein
LRTNAAPVGVPPDAKGSGQHRSERRFTGVRFELRRALYHGHAHRLTATGHNRTIRAACQRVLAAGKLKKIALTACLRKLLAILSATAKTHTSSIPYSLTLDTKDGYSGPRLRVRLAPRRTGAQSTIRRLGVRHPRALRFHVKRHAAETTQTTSRRRRACRHPPAAQSAVAPPSPVSAAIVVAA